MFIVGVQASRGLRYVIMLRSRLQVSCIYCAGVRFNLVSEIRLFTLVFLHHRALLSLPQSSYSTNTSSSRAVCVQCDTECPAMACIAVYCSRELFPIPVTYVYIIYGIDNRSQYRYCCKLVFEYRCRYFKGQNFSPGTGTGTLATAF